MAAVDAADAAGREVTVVASFLRADEARTALGRSRRPVPCFTYPETAARALGRAVSYATWRARPVEDEPVLDGCDPNAARRVLEAHDATGARAAGGR